MVGGAQHVRTLDGYVLPIDIDNGLPYIGAVPVALAVKVDRCDLGSCAEISEMIGPCNLLPPLSHQHRIPDYLVSMWQVSMKS